MTLTTHIPYFAYGANMVPRQMAERCPTARIAGTARLPGYRFIIATCGYASIVPATDTDDALVHGILWHVTAADVVALDLFEEVGTALYFKSEASVITATGVACQAMVYMARDPNEGVPAAEYLPEIIDTASQFGFPNTYVEMMRGWVERK